MSFSFRFQFWNSPVEQGMGLVDLVFKGILRTEAPGDGAPFR